jgi:hypothetical protein
VRSFHLKIAGREEGPYEEAQIAQMFADGRANRNTPCKPANGGEWKSIDDYLPMLKYGTQLPPPTPMPDIPPTPPPVFVSQRVSVVDFDIPFWSVLGIMFKWMAAGFVVLCCFLPIIVVLWVFVMTVLMGLIGGAMSSLHHP